MVISNNRNYYGLLYFQTQSINPHSPIYHNLASSIIIYLLNAKTFLNTYFISRYSLEKHNKSEVTVYKHKWKISYNCQSVAQYWSDIIFSHLAEVSHKISLTVLYFQLLREYLPISSPRTHLLAQLPHQVLQHHLLLTHSQLPF